MPWPSFFCCFLPAPSTSCRGFPGEFKGESTGSTLLGQTQSIFSGPRAFFRAPSELCSRVRGCAGSAKSRVLLHPFLERERLRGILRRTELREGVQVIAFPEALSGAPFLQELSNTMAAAMSWVHSATHAPIPMGLTLQQRTRV